MKRFWLGLSAVFSLAGSAHAQAGQACLPCDQGQQRYVYRRCCPPEDQAEQQGTEPEGMFVAPGPTGDVSGEANSIGLRLGRIHIPEMSIPLPTIQLPHLVRYRRGPEMVTDTANAAFQSGRPAAALQFAKPKEPEAKPQGAPPSKMGCDPCYPLGRAGTDEHVQRLERQVAQLSQLVETMATREQRFADSTAPDNAINPASYEAPSSIASLRPTRRQGSEQRTLEAPSRLGVRPAAAGREGRSGQTPIARDEIRVIEASHEESGFSSVFD